MAGRGICISPPGSTWDLGHDKAPGVNNAVPSTSNVFTPFIPTSSMVPGIPITKALNFTTAFWAVPTITTATRVIEKSVFEAVQERVKWCPDFTNADISYELLPDNCQNAWDPYCAGTATKDPPLPSPTTIPASCSPAYYPTAKAAG
ncbi:hypothetical protein MMC07_006782 [Pseudocyphellaria aurata]|nr:hypothetical protein [Pseudocyphellaria aurata]